MAESSTRTDGEFLSPPCDSLPELPCPLLFRINCVHLWILADQESWMLMLWNSRHMPTSLYAFFHPAWRDTIRAKLQSVEEAKKAAETRPLDIQKVSHFDWTSAFWGLDLEAANLQILGHQKAFHVSVISSFHSDLLCLSSQHLHLSPHVAFPTSFISFI